jgi:hypothetical protein
VLISDLTVMDVTAIVVRSRPKQDRSGDIILGTLFELERDATTNTVHRSLSFGTNRLREHWVRFSSEFVGCTNFTDEEISVECSNRL